MRLPERGYMEQNFQKEIIKKKHMLDLMMQKKMSRRKKKIIKVYGKDMLAEMYLDLLNITENDSIPKRILSPLSGRLPKKIKNIKNKVKNNWNNDNTIHYQNNNNFKLNSVSIFNIPHKRSRSKSRSLSKNKNSTRSRNIDQPIAENAEATKNAHRNNGNAQRNSKRTFTSKTKNRMNRTHGISKLIS